MSSEVEKILVNSQEVVNSKARVFKSVSYVSRLLMLPFRNKEISGLGNVLTYRIILDVTITGEIDSFRCSKTELKSWSHPDNIKI